MKKLKAELHRSDGSIGREILKIKCVEDGEAMPVRNCHNDYCTANRGNLRWFDDGEWKVVTWCAFEDLKKENA